MFEKPWRDGGMCARCEYELVDEARRGEAARGVGWGGVGDGW